MATLAWNEAHKTLVSNLKAEQLDATIGLEIRIVSRRSYRGEMKTSHKSSFVIHILLELLRALQTGSHSVHELCPPPAAIKHLQQNVSTNIHGSDMWQHPQTAHIQLNKYSFVLPRKAHCKNTSFIANIKCSPFSVKNQHWDMWKYLQASY